MECLQKGVCITIAANGCACSVYRPVSHATTLHTPHATKFKKKKPETRSLGGLGFSSYSPPHIRGSMLASSAPRPHQHMQSTRAPVPVHIGEAYNAYI